MADPAHGPAFSEGDDQRWKQHFHDKGKRLLRDALKRPAP